MRKKKKNNYRLIDWMMWIMFFMANTANLLDIQTTYQFTNHYTDFSLEANRWMIYNAEGGYLDIWLKTKFAIVFLMTTSLIGISRLTNHIFPKLVALMTMTFIANKFITLVIENMLVMHQLNIPLF